MRSVVMGNILCRLMAFVFICILFSSPSGVEAANYEIKKISGSVYAAIALPGGKAVDNAMFVVTGNEVILTGAHFIPEMIGELLKEIGKITQLPVSHVILTHHHRGYNHVDFDFPDKVEVVTSIQVWQEISAELREFKNPNTVFENSLTINRGTVSLVLMNMGRGHSAGDIMVFLPKEGVLFASGLFYNDAVGYMGEAFVHDWGENLDYMETIPARVIIPGIGKPADGSGLARFRKFYRSFMTEVLRNIEKGNSLSQTKKEFNLDEYRDLPGFDTFLGVNLERAYKQLKTN